MHIIYVESCVVLSYCLMIPYQLLISQLSHEGGELQSGRGTFQGMYPR